MSDESATPTPATTPTPEVKKKPTVSRVVVRPMPKVIFFWPLWICSLAFGLIGDGLQSDSIGTVWMIIFTINLIVIAFDFSEVISVMVLAIVAVIILAALQFGFIQPIQDFFADLDIRMNKAFYYSMFGLFTIIYAIVFLKSRFDYWEFRYNEVIHRRGIFADIKRYSTEDLRWFKEVPDVLERILAASGRMILTTPREQHPIVIEHVIGISRIDEQIADILGVKRVTVD